MILEELNKDLYTALKEKDTEKMSALRYLLSKIKNKEIEIRSEGREVQDPEILQIIKKQIKERNQSIEGYKQANRPEAVEKETYELNLLEGYYTKFGGDNSNEQSPRQ
jgi:uncharacterized protein